MNNTKNNIRGNSLAISKTLKILDNIIRSGGEPGQWPGECPMRNECQDISDLRKRGKFLSWSFLASIFTLFTALVLFSSTTLSRDQEIPKEPETTPKPMIFQSKFTGTKVGRASNSDTSPADIYWSAHRFDRSFVRVERWQIDEEWLYFTIYPGLDDSTFVSREPSAPKGRSGKKLESTILRLGESILNGIEYGNAIPVGKATEEIEGVPVLFQKWEARHPETNELILLWVGRPVSHQ